MPNARAQDLRSAMVTGCRFSANGVKHDLSEIEISQVLKSHLISSEGPLVPRQTGFAAGEEQKVTFGKVARTGTNMPSTIAKREQRSNFIGANGLASDNPSPARSGQSCHKLQSCLPYHFDPQLLTRHSHSSVTRPEKCF